jgi:hypothetical protein
MEVQFAKVDLYVDPTSASVGYPPCEDGVVLHFKVEPGGTYPATALYTIGTTIPPKRVELFQFQGQRDAVAQLFDIQLPDPPASSFSKQLNLTADIPQGVYTPVVVTCVLANGVTVITVKKASAGLRSKQNFADLLA